MTTTTKVCNRTPGSGRNRGKGAEVEYSIAGFTGGWLNANKDALREGSICRL
jgi:hypothetical protein